MISDDSHSSFRRAEPTVAWTLVLIGLFVFFWRQPIGIADAMRLALPDRDDAIRLLGARDLLAGQSWFDMTQYRYLAPDGVSMHWSRLVDVPLAGGILALTPLLGAGLAERIFVTAWPLFLFVVYAGVIFWGAWRLFGPRAGGLAVLIASQMIVFGDLFAPGRVDHHNIQIILVSLAAIAFGLSRRHAGAAIASGIASALSLAIGLETLPVVAIVGIAFALSWVVAGERAARPFLFFGVSSAIVAAVAFAAQTAPWLWLTPACDALSGPWLLLTTGGGIAAAVLVVATPRLSSWQARLIAAVLAGSLPLVAFAAWAPACLGGPYQIVPEPFRSIWLRDILEAYSFRRFLMVNPSAAMQAIAPMLLGAIVATLGAWRDRGEGRAMLALLASLLWLGVMLAQYQIRTAYITSAFYPLVAGWFLDRLLATARERRSILVRSLSVVCAILMFGLTWAVGVALAEALRRGEGSAPPSRVACHDPQNVAPLAVLPPGLVLGQVDLGPNILLHTPHSIVVAGYHRATAGIIAGVEAFSGSEADMRRHVDQFHVDYVVVCPNWLPGANAAQKPFARELAEGRSVAWLQPLHLPAGPLMAWRVVRDR